MVQAAPFVAVRDGRLVAMVGYGPAASPPGPSRFAAWLRNRIFPGLDAVEIRVPAALANPDLAAGVAEHLGAAAPAVRVIVGQ